MSGMWIETAYGQLLNLDHCVSVRAKPGGRENGEAEGTQRFDVVADVAGDRMSMVTVIGGLPKDAAGDLVFDLRMRLQAPRVQKDGHLD